MTVEEIVSLFASNVLIAAILVSAIIVAYQIIREAVEP